MEFEYILYIRDDCPYCKMAITLLENKNMKHRAVDFSSNAKLLAEIKSLYGWNTVPVIFEIVEEDTYKLIGGYTDLRELIEIEENE